MMPCKFCGLTLSNGRQTRGLKQVGKTRYEGSRFHRKYRCQDCGATCSMSGECSPRMVEDWQLGSRQVAGAGTDNRLLSARA